MFTFSYQVENIGVFIPHMAPRSDKNLFQSVRTTTRPVGLELRLRPLQTTTWPRSKAGDTDGKVPISFSSLIRREKKAQIHGGGGRGEAEADGLVPLVGCFLLFTRQMARQAPHHIKHMLRANSKAGGGEVCFGRVILTSPLSSAWLPSLFLLRVSVQRFGASVDLRGLSASTWTSGGGSITHTHVRTHTLRGIDGDSRQFYGQFKKKKKS